MDKKKNFRVPNWENLELAETNGKSTLYLQYIRDRINRNYPNATQTVVAYTHASTAVDNSYYGSGVVAPNGRIYLMTYNQATATVWHYIETNGSVVAYSHTGVTLMPLAYRGGVLAPNGRIYLVPGAQATATVWHYIDTTKEPGATGHIVSYSRWTGAVLTSSIGGVVGLNGNIYFLPFGQASATQWCYINTSGVPLGYSHGISSMANIYIGGCLAPDGKIYLIPYGVQSVWHYIDTTKNPGDSGHVVAYTHGTTYGANAYYGGALSPDGKIYFGPAAQSSATVWHYIDTTKTPGTVGHVVAYTHGTGVGANAYTGISPVAPNGRMYLIPRNQKNATIWHYIDTTKTPGTTGHVAAYTHGATIAGGDVPYYGSALLPNGRIYFSPCRQGIVSIWHYIDTGIGEDNENSFSNNYCTSPYPNVF